MWTPTNFAVSAPSWPGTQNGSRLYASSKDRALGVSKRIHGYPRAGDSGDGLVVLPSVDTIDATDVDTSLVGHSYYGDNRSILTDLFTLLKHGNAPPRFGMTRAGLRAWTPPTGPFVPELSGAGRGPQREVLRCRNPKTVQEFRDKLMEFCQNREL